MLRIYQELLGKNCWLNVACVITHADFKPDDHETVEEYNAYLNEVEVKFKDSFRAKFQANLKQVIAVDLTKSIKKGIRNKIHQKVLDSKLALIHSELSIGVYDPKEMKRAFTKDVLISFMKSY